MHVTPEDCAEILHSITAYKQYLLATGTAAMTLKKYLEECHFLTDWALQTSNQLQAQQSIRARNKSSPMPTDYQKDARFCEIVAKFPYKPNIPKAFSKWLELNEITRDTLMKSVDDYLIYLRKTGFQSASLEKFLTDNFWASDWYEKFYATKEFNGRKN